MGHRIEIDVDAIVQQHRNGVTLVEIAANLSVSASTVRNRLVDAGELPRHARAGSQRVDLDMDSVARQYRADLPAVEIAAASGVCWETIQSRLVEMGEPVRHLGGRRRLIDYQGERLPLAEWSRRTGIGRKTLSARLCLLGWTVEQALTTPVKE
jgi:hypothetical protein